MVLYSNSFHLNEHKLFTTSNRTPIYTYIVTTFLLATFLTVIKITNNIYIAMRSSFGSELSITFILFVCTNNVHCNMILYHCTSKQIQNTYISVISTITSIIKHVLKTSVLSIKDIFMSIKTISV
jgi:hypothetical protein